MKRLSLPLSNDTIEGLKYGDLVYLSGRVYTARDAAHKRLTEAIKNNMPLNFELKDACIFYTGPCPAKPGIIMNSCGPTTSMRMDAYAPTLYDADVKCVLGKGPVGAQVKRAIVKNRCVYFALTGGAGALLSQCVLSSRLVAYEDLGAEAVFELEIKDMPAIVAVDFKGGDIYIKGPEMFRNS